MSVGSSRAFISYTPASRQRRARGKRLAAVLVVAAVASSALVLQAFYSQPPTAPGVTRAFAYFPN